MNKKNEQREINRVRKNRIVFRVDDDELKFINAKMKAMCMDSRETYLRKMAIDGQCIRYDYGDFETEIRRCNYLISNISNNINQIAKRVNSTNNIYSEDIEELQKQIIELRERQLEIMKLFVKEVEEI